MKKTKNPYDVVLRLGKQTFLIFKNIYVLYDPESTWWVDDRIRRIDEKVYAGDLIQNQYGIVLKHTAEEDIEKIITDYFCVDPDIVAYAAVNPKLNQNYDNEGRELSTYKMRERYEQTQKSWKDDIGDMVDTKIIYQGDSIPIKLPGVSEVEIYNKDYGIFGIHNYENWIPDPTRYAVGDIYHISGEFVADTGFDKYTKTSDVKIFTWTHNVKDYLPEKILVPKKGFIDDKTFNCIGNDPVELDIFFRFDQVDTDSWYMTVLLITSPMDSYLKKKYPHIPGNLEGAYNSSTKISATTADIPKRFRWRPENTITQKKTVYVTNEDTNILSDEEKSLIESVLDIVINLHSRDDYEHVLLSIQKTVDDKLDKRLVEDAVVISESAAGIKLTQPINDVDAVLPPIMTGLEGKGYNKNLKLIHDAANYWGNKAKEERKEKLFGGNKNGDET